MNDGVMEGTCMQVVTLHRKRFRSTCVSAAAIGISAVEQDINTAGTTPVIPEDSFTGAQNSIRDARDTGLWPSLLMAAALTSIVIGIVWDISWHETIGRDT